MTNVENSFSGKAKNQKRIFHPLVASPVPLPVRRQNYEVVISELIQSFYLILSERQYLFADDIWNYLRLSEEMMNVCKIFCRERGWEFQIQMIPIG